MNAPGRTMVTRSDGKDGCGHTHTAVTPPMMSAKPDRSMDSVSISGRWRRTRGRL